MLCDFEFRAPDGEWPEPICMVAREWRTGRTVWEWADRLASMSQPPFPIGADALFVAYYASAELGCFRALSWPMPAYEKAGIPAKKATEKAVHAGKRIAERVRAGVGVRHIPEAADMRKAVHDYRNWAETDRQRAEGAFKDEAKERVS